VSLPRRALLALVTAGFVGALIVGSLSSSPGPSPQERPGASADDQGPGGLYGWRALLESAGREVRTVGSSPASADLDPEETAVLLDAGRLAEADAVALREFLEDGGRLVAGGDLDGDALEAITGLDASRSTTSGITLAPLVPAPETAGVATIEADSPHGYTEAGGALPLAGGAGAAPSLLRAAVGDGTAILVADSSPLTNSLLTSADNAALSLGLPGQARPVVFLERVRAAEGSGLAALPAAWGWAAAGLLLAALALIAARGRRLGPPDQLARALPPARHEYVEAVAASLQRTGDSAAVAERLRRSAVDELARRSGLRSDAGEDELRAAGAGLGLGDAELDAILGRAGSRDVAGDASSALAKLMERNEWR
jgi:hypothetical protein